MVAGSLGMSYKKKRTNFQQLTRGWLRLCKEQEDIRSLDERRIIHTPRKEVRFANHLKVAGF